MDIEHCLICECHLVELGELKLLIHEAKDTVLKGVEDLKAHRIIGHGCGQCLKTWEYELEQLLVENDQGKVDF